VAGWGSASFFFFCPRASFIHPPCHSYRFVRFPHSHHHPNLAASHRILFYGFFFSIGRHFSSSLIAFPSTSLSLAQGCADLPSSSLPLISLSTSLFIHAMHLRWSAPRSVAFGSFVSFLSFLFFLFSHCEIAMNLLFLSLLLNKLC